MERSIRLDDESLASSARTGLTIYGSKEVTVIGINARNGHVCYFCDGNSGENGCSVENAAVDDCGLTDEDDVIVVRRVSHAVKALKTRTGEQRWNYSVAQNHLRLEEGPGSDSSHFPPPRRSAKNDVVITTCDQPASSASSAEKRLRFDVLQGRVIVGANSGSRYDFKVPIANAWLVSKGKLNVVNLFDAKNLVSSSSSSSSSGSSNFLTFVGSFDNQYYVQHSNQFHDLVSLRSGRQSINNRELEWHSGPRSIGMGTSKKPTLSISKMTPAVGQTRTHEETAVTAWRPGINPGDYLRPVNEYQLEVGTCYLFHLELFISSFDRLNLFSLSHFPEFSKLSGASQWWRQILKIRNLFLLSPYVSMGISFLATTCLVLVVTFLVQCKHWRDVAVNNTLPLTKMPSFTDSGIETPSLRGYIRSESSSIGGCRSLPILPRYSGSPNQSPVPRPLPDIVEPRPEKQVYFASPSSIEFDSRFYQDFEPMKCLGE